MNLAKKGAALLLIMLLVIGTSVPAFAAERVTLTLQLRIGSSSALVNGEKQVVEKPYVQNGTAMVPLGVFQRAFGTTSRLEGDDVVRVAYGKRTLTFTIGSKTAWINGKKLALSAVPVMKSGTLMVPLRPVTDMIGAKVKITAGTIVATLASDKGIPGQKPASNATDETERVGSSYAGWSIDYPADALAQLGDSEYSATMSDAQGSYMLQIHVWNEDADVPVSDMLEQLKREAGEAGETVMDEMTLPDAAVPYAQLITRDLDGIYWEARRYYDKGRVYSLYLGDSLVEDYRGFETRAALLDSFRTSFATAGRKTEDLSNVKNGRMDASAPDYGVSLKVPAGWVPTGGGALEYRGEDGSLLSLSVTSAAKGETLEDWHKLLQKRTDEIFLPGYAEPISVEPVKISGQDGRIEKLTFDSGGGKQYWNWLVTKHEGYFYILHYAAPEGAYSDSVFGKIVQSVEIDFDTVASSFGRLGQVPYLKDKSLSATYSTPDFVMSAPAYWTSQSGLSAQPSVRYDLPGGLLQVSLVDVGFEAAAAQTLKHYEELKLDDATLAYEAPKRTVFAGAPAIRIAYTGTDGSPYRAEDLYLRHNNRTYWIHYSLDQASATPEQLAGIERALQSFKFLK
ncbi:stalk domain-containing protein [Saccharibacillus alkalitolerans]|uniref:Copper amine oxidase-like N-terminal domain-containing protein n=1 Tax=Saccharibacillus alkalitolerans TaxID=2705290 RepID=A0ABX0F5S3_9BACL|nr:stalk domain-containing protein [Saccharibacillus alkalitolerans]NGZ76067.1 hypothetical protein [Saccharibacillus alkalitolerans]